MSCTAWPPPRRPSPLHIAIPGSVLSTEHTLMMKTVKAGIIARILAIHRVDQVWVFRDPETSRQDMRLLTLLLKYASTPPHLKKKLFPLSSALKYAGLMPPLNLANHEVPSRPEPGAVMDGYVEECTGGSCRVFLGRLGYGLLKGKAREGSVVTVRIVAAGSRLVVEEASWDRVYTGFKVAMKSAVEDLIRDARRSGLGVVATSRKGECVETIPNRGLLILFGGPHTGLLDYLDPNIFDAVVNTVPLQGARTVRTEEAMHATLTRVRDSL